MKRCLVRSSTPTIRYTLCLAALVAAGCDRAPVPPAPRLTLTPDSVVLAPHGSVRLTPTVTGMEGDPRVGYYSSDAAVASVDDAGVAHAVGYGSAWVQAWVVTRPALADSTLVRVPAPAGPWVVVSPDSVMLYAGGWAQLGWRVGNVVDTTGSTAVRLTSSDTAIVEARASGLLCSHRTGDAFVRVALVGSPGAADSARVHVLPGPPHDAESPPPSVSIASIVDSAGKPVDLGAVRGTITVNLSLDTPSWRCLPPFALQLRFDSALWGHSPEMEWGTLRSYAFTVDTRSKDAAGQPLLPNGNHTLSIVARDTTGMAYMSTSMSLVISN